MRSGTNLSSRHSLHTTAYAGMLISLISICSWISIPTTIPFTLQTFAVFLTILLSGLKQGITTILAYILLGAAGMPVFSGFRGGLGVLLGATGGYITGFLLTAVISGSLIHIFGKKLRVIIIAFLLGLIACYTFGTMWFVIFYSDSGSSTDIRTALSLCVTPFVIPDILKLSFAIAVFKRLKYIFPGVYE